MLLWTAFTVGLFGSLHCVGMCGPIAFIVGGQKTEYRWLNAILYNAGRVVTYMLMGAVIGLIGKGLFMAGLQKWVSIIIGISLLAVAIFSVNIETKIVNIPFVSRLMTKLKSQLGVFLQKHSFNAYFAVGLLNGLLPCGLVYMGIAGAMSTSDITSSIAYMAMFGLGTFPMMVASTMVGNVASVPLRKMVKRVYPVLLILFAFLFLMRGLNFDLPSDFLFWENMDEMPKCH